MSHFSLIAGPSGVGKSLTAKALAKAMMKDTQSSSHNEWCGVTTINGHFYSSHDQARVRLYTKQVRHGSLPHPPPALRAHMVLLKTTSVLAVKKCIPTLRSRATSQSSCVSVRAP